MSFPPASFASLLTDDLLAGLPAPERASQRGAALPPSAARPLLAHCAHLWRPHALLPTGLGTPPWREFRCAHCDLADIRP